MNKVAAFALRRKNSILSMSEKMFCPPQPLRFWITPARAGKVRVQAPVQEHRGITPAHAGKRPGWADSGCQRGDHPCVCGEKIFEHPVSLANQGSLPRVRGKALADYAVIPNIGITPACAGKSPAMMVCSLEYWGSPPRVQGKVKPVLWAARVAGITPACAGKSGCSSSSSGVPWDHPRACGEKISL